MDAAPAAPPEGFVVDSTVPLDSPTVPDGAITLSQALGPPDLSPEAGGPARLSPKPIELRQATGPSEMASTAGLPDLSSEFGVMPSLAGVDPQSGARTPAPPQSSQVAEMISQFMAPPEGFIFDRVTDPLPQGPQQPLPVAPPFGGPFAAPKEDLIRESGVREIAQAAKMTATGTTPYGPEYDARLAGELGKRLSWWKTYVFSLGGKIGPKGLRDELLKEAEGFEGFGSALMPAAGGTGETALEWGVVLPKLFKAAGLAGKGIESLPKVKAAKEALAKAGGIAKLAEKYPRAIAAADQAVRSFGKGASAGSIIAGAESIGKDMEPLDVLDVMATRGAKVGGMAAVFSLASSMDSKLYADALRKDLLKQTKARYDAKLNALPKGRADAGARKIIHQETMEVRQIDNVVAAVERDLMNLKAGKMYREGQEGVESPYKMADRLYKYGYKGRTVVPKAEKGLTKGYGTRPTVEQEMGLPKTRAGEVVEDVRAAVKQVGKTKVSRPTLQPPAKPLATPPAKPSATIPMAPPKGFVIDEVPDVPVAETGPKADTTVPADDKAVVAPSAAQESQVPEGEAFITKAERKVLQGQGYSIGDIAKMTPVEARTKLEEVARTDFPESTPAPSPPAQTATEVKRKETGEAGPGAEWEAKTKKKYDAKIADRVARADEIGYTAPEGAEPYWIPVETGHGKWTVQEPGGLREGTWGSRETVTKAADTRNKARAAEQARVADQTRPKKGKPYRVKVYRGEGKSYEDIYGPGADGPILGPGTYWAQDRKHAQYYGDKITESEVELKNPYILKNDDQLWGLMDVKGEIPWSNEERSPLLKNARKKIEGAGYDGVIVQVPSDRDMDDEGNSMKRLREMFGHDQIIVFDEAKATPAEKAPSQPQKVQYTSTPREWLTHNTLYASGRKGLRLKRGEAVKGRKMFIWQSDFDEVPVRLPKATMDAFRARTDEVFKVIDKRGNDYYLVPTQVVADVKAARGDAAFKQSPKPSRTPGQQINDAILSAKRQGLTDAELGEVVLSLGGELGIAEGTFSATQQELIEAYRNEQASEDVSGGVQEGVGETVPDYEGAERAAIQAEREADKGRLGKSREHVLYQQRAAGTIVCTGLARLVPLA